MTTSRRAVRPQSAAPGEGASGGAAAAISAHEGEPQEGQEDAAREDAGPPDASSNAAAPAPPPDLVPLRAPRGGVPPVIATPSDVQRYADALAAGTGPVAVDAERASSYRYGQNAYLVQLRREGAGTGLIDPIALDGDLRVLGDALRGVEWVLHAADQDLPCLADVGMRPDALFDTELAARLLGRSRVSLRAVAADDLGVELAKEHSAVDWSRRPLPHDWLVYAALDVELLVDLRATLAEQLIESGKAEWARQEFERVRTAPPRQAAAEPWRRLPKLSTMARSPRQLAVARELWEARDDLARRRDRSPSLVLSSAAIVAAAHAVPRSAAALSRLPEFSGKGVRPHVDYWFAAVQRALALPESQLPSRRAPRPAGHPQPRAWRELKPLAHDRLEAVHEVVRPLAERLLVPQENLLQPAVQKALAWSVDANGTITTEEMASTLRDLGARPWQVDLVAQPLARALSEVHRA